MSARDSSLGFGSGAKERGEKEETRKSSLFGFSCVVSILWNERASGKKKTLPTLSLSSLLTHFFQKLSLRAPRCSVLLLFTFFVSENNHFEKKAFSGAKNSKGRKNR